MSQLRPFHLCVAAALLFAPSTLRAADPATGVPPDQATFTPGKEIKILRESDILAKLAK